LQELKDKSELSDEKEANIQNLEKEISEM